MQRRAIPLIRPMLATAGPLPAGDDWAYELKWDGVRAVAYLDAGPLRLLSRCRLRCSPPVPLKCLISGWRR